jgi:hypothetical protein
MKKRKRLGWKALKAPTPQSSHSEEWKDVVGYEGYYLVSDQGRVYSLIRGIYRRAGVDSRGYPYVTLQRNGKEKPRNFTLGYLVLHAFVGDRPDAAATVNHKDGNKFHNWKGNLEYLPILDNIRHAIANGLKGVYGEENPRAKLTNSQVKEIFLNWKAGWTRRELSEKFHASLSVIDRIIYRMGWKTVTDELVA